MILKCAGGDCLAHGRGRRQRVRMRWRLHDRFVSVILAHHLVDSPCLRGGGDDFSPGRCWRKYICASNCQFLPYTLISCSALFEASPVDHAHFPFPTQNFRHLCGLRFPRRHRRCPIRRQRVSFFSTPYANHFVRFPASDSPGANLSTLSR